MKPLLHIFAVCIALLVLFPSLYSQNHLARLDLERSTDGLSSWQRVPITAGMLNNGSIDLNADTNSAFYRMKIVFAPTPSPTPSPTPNISVNVSTLAGSGVSGLTNGSGTTANFGRPAGIAVDETGSIYVSDTALIRKVSKDGFVTTLAGVTSGFLDGKGGEAMFNYPVGIVPDGNSGLYVADQYNHRVRRISSGGIVATLAGNGEWAVVLDGIYYNSTFYYPTGIAVDQNQNVYVADLGNNRIRKINNAGNVTTIAGSGVRGFSDGIASNAQFNRPSGAAVDASGNVYVADRDNNRIRKISPEGIVSTFAGSGTAGFADGAGVNASFNSPRSIVTDGNGNLYVADSGNHKIRKITSGGGVSTVAGSGSQGFADGNGNDALFNYPSGVAVDGSGNVYVADSGNYRIRKITISQ
jgi:sugar lactone lactonase YvrE